MTQRNIQLIFLWSHYCILHVQVMVCCWYGLSFPLVSVFQWSQFSGGLSFPVVSVVHWSQLSSGLSCPLVSVFLVSVFLVSVFPVSVFQWSQFSGGLSCPLVSVVWSPKCIEFKCHNSNSIDTFSYPLRLRSATALHLSLTICALDQYFLQLNSQEILFL